MVRPSQCVNSISKSLINGHEVLIPVRAFCDGSGSMKTSRFVVLAGVAAEESVWAGFERDWDAILKARDPIAPYLHMNEVVAGEGSFHNDNGWDDDKRRQLITDCLLYSQTLDKLKFKTFICSVDMEVYRRLRAVHPHFPTVASICNKNVSMEIFKWYLEEFSSRQRVELYYFFDQNEKFKGPFEQLKIKRQKKTWSGLYNAWDIIRGVHNENMRTTLPLQLADMLAWAHHRRLTPSTKDLSWSSLHIMLDAVLPFRRREAGEKYLSHIAEWLDHGGIVKDYLETLNPFD